jgi:Flp pilus assembly protein CpaB
LASPTNNNTNGPAAYAIVRDARVLAIGQNTGAPVVAPSGSPAPGPAPTVPVNTQVTLAVTPQQADIIMAADLNGTVRLALRSAHEPARSLGAETIVYESRKPAAPAGPPKPEGVVVINGSSVTRVVP